MKGVLPLLTAISIVSGCSNQPSVTGANGEKYLIDNKTYRSPNFSSRPRSLVIHYTVENFATAINDRFLTSGVVAVHYLIPDPTEASYKEQGFTSLRIFNLVDEDQGAWHAGASAWENRVKLNDSSIAVDLVNLASENNGTFTFPPFNDEQIEATIALCKDILKRYPDIQPTQVVGHGDISLDRKSDPGAAFPWKKLYDNGVGAWFDESTKEKYVSLFRENGIPSNDDIVKKLSAYGYGIEILPGGGYAFKQFITTGSGENIKSDPAALSKTIRVFQLHFRQQKYDGVIDIETAAILYALVEKYFPGKL
ncbi:N-acetylmuramoyl-L-alanine amidase [Shimwellia pseudoproteus]|uniref:N-acetylmuramoyl-L-alanine amidase n=1 Tax=Shimwellia pseudoproteus TaxID=570012 RepID=UPI0018EDE72B|nr:N-acetylmuramoyl-L-alanine amidase [Shimwellia pseudoproteus]MBJ3816678.1 N-acetylmuramoyl-L-alanine amidase [Shimwellia pseudoproteus]